ncbi:hypothetical protein IV203_018360 [Nitzschia inconspicua]|uniref:Uncharacterized protein n=1 Tax=Nitzschia inconspicua TaxID=303405 RepID=A0A9K3M1R2_9STRA|nr:hypothetical protein IV203_018360 [Nitzschia inconspicua]
MDFVEERLQVLDGWLADQPDNEILHEKRDEYAGLYEELNILTKKLKKTAKLLLEENQKEMLLKLTKKQEQYSHEIEDILAYVDQDEMFMEAEMDPSDLLGVPLETLVEQPGMEGSSSNLNFSVSDLPYMQPPPKKKSPNITTGKSLANGNNHASGVSGLDHHNQDTGDTEHEELHPIKEELSSHCNTSMASLSASMTSLSIGNISSHDAVTLRKKLKKVEKLLENSDAGTMDHNQIKKLKKKREEYIRALERVDMLDLDDGNKSFHSFADSSVATMDVSTSSLFRMASSNSSGNKLVNPKSYNKNTLQKKLKKVRKLLKSTTNEQELASYRRKEQEYQQALDNIMASGSSQSIIESSSAGTSIALDDALLELDDDERKQLRTLQKKIKKADKLLAEAQQNGDTKDVKKLRSKRDEYSIAMEKLTKSAAARMRQRCLRSPLLIGSSSKPQSFEEKNEKTPQVLSKERAAKQNSIIDVDDGLENIPTRRDKSLLQKKLSKIDAMIGRVPKESKEYKKLSKKRRLYLDEIGPDLGRETGDVRDIASGSVSVELSLDILNHASAFSLDVSSRSVGVRQSDGETLVESTLDDTERAKCQGNDTLLQKKLLKVEQMLLDIVAKRGRDAEHSRKYNKLLKKRQELITKLESFGRSGRSGQLDHFRNISSTLMEHINVRKDPGSKNRDNRDITSEACTEEYSEEENCIWNSSDEIDHVDQLFEIVDYESEKGSLEDEYQSEEEHSVSEDDLFENTQESIAKKYCDFESQIIPEIYSEAVTKDSSCDSSNRINTVVASNKSNADNYLTKEQNGFDEYALDISGNSDKDCSEPGQSPCQDLDVEVENQIKVLQFKKAKAEQLMVDLIVEQGDAAEDSKKYKAFEMKRLQFMRVLEMLEAKMDASLFVEVEARGSINVETEEAAVQKQFQKEARQLKEEAQERRRKDKEKAATISVTSNHETDEEKRKKAFLEEAQALKQAAMEKKHQERGS